MNASKEECRRAIERLERVVTNLSGEVSGGIWSAVEQDLNQINSFLSAAVKRLPSEEAVERDRLKNRASGDVADAARRGFRGEPAE